MPVKVEQINEYLFSDTVQSQKNKKLKQKVGQKSYRCIGWLLQAL